MFPLLDSGYTEAASDAFDAMTSMFSGPFQDIMHIVVTALVILLSIVSLLFIIIGGYRKKQYVSLAVWAAVALTMMMIGGLGVMVIPNDMIGVLQRFSNFAAVGFTAVLGVYLFNGFSKYHS